MDREKSQMKTLFNYINHPQRLLLLAVALFSLSGCDTWTLPAVNPSISTCSEVSPLFSVESALSNTSHPCYAWVEDVHGRVAKSGASSAVVWSLNTEAGTGVIVSAIHTLDSGWYEPTGSAIPESLVSPVDQAGVARIRLVLAESGLPDTQVTPMYELYNPPVPEEENGPGFGNILPRHDFYIAAIDSQKLGTGNSTGPSAPITNDAPVVFDPGSYTTSESTWARSESDSLVLLSGYPAAYPFAGQQATSIGRVLSDSEAEAAIDFLKQQGDVEGDITYDAQAEMMIEGRASGGMSGGGVFNSNRRLVGIIVRASDPIDDRQYVRAVRMSFIVSQLRSAFDSLEPDEQMAVEPYLEFDE